MRTPASLIAPFAAITVIAGLAAVSFVYSGAIDHTAMDSKRARDAIEALLELKLAQATEQDVAQALAAARELTRVDLDNVDSAIALERAKLIEKRRERESATQSMHVFVIGLSVAATGIILIAARRLIRAQREQHRVELGLLEANRFLDSLVENIPTMLFVKDAAGLRFHRVNRAGEELLNMKRDELIGKNDFDFFPHDEAVFFQSKDRQALNGGKVVTIEQEPIETKHGRRWLHTSKVPILDANGQPAFLLGISQDITESKAQAEALKQAVQEANNAAKELESFSYSVAHDLRSPLRSIDGFSLALLEDNGEQLDANGKAHIARVRAAAQRMALLIDDLLSLTRVSRRPLERATVDMTQLAQQVAAELEVHAPGRTIRWKIHEHMTANGDVHLLRVLLENLLGNAVKFTDRRAEAVIEVGQEADGTFFVSDNGAGFDMQYVDKLFGVFQRLHAMTDYPGTGIGLVSVQRIVNRHGGRIWAEGAVELGAVFRFTLTADRSV